MITSTDQLITTRERSARAREYSFAVILSNNSFSVSLRTFAAEIPCKHWRSAEIAARWDTTRERVKPLTEAPRSLSAAISSPYQSEQLTLWVGAEFFILCLAIIADIVFTDSANGLCHPRHVWAWLSDTFSANGLIDLSGARLASHNSAQFASHNGGQFLTLNAATVCIIQGCYGKYHIAARQLATLKGSKGSLEANIKKRYQRIQTTPSHTAASARLKEG